VLHAFFETELGYKNFVLPKQDCMHVVIHYSEIGTKGGNRDFFEKALMNNVGRALGTRAKCVFRRYGRILCELSKQPSEKEVVEVFNIPIYQRNLGVWWFNKKAREGRTALNAMGIEIEKDYINKELNKKDGFRIFHPYFKSW